MQELNELSLLSISEATKLLSISRANVGHLIKSGHIGIIAVNKRYKIPYRELQRYIEEATVRLPEIYGEDPADDLDEFMNGTKRICNKTNKPIIDDSFFIKTISEVN